MKKVLQGIPGAISYLDNIMVSTATEEEHLQNLDFLVSSMSYLGHLINEEGWHPLPDKVQAVAEAPRPRSVQELKA